MLALMIATFVVIWATGGSERALLVWQVFLVWPSIAISAKRWHDRDKSGWWILINLVPIIGGFWALIENGFLRGTAGANRFGPDPVAA